MSTLWEVWPYSCYLLSPIDINFHRPLDYSTLSRSSMNNNTRHAMLASRSSSPSDEWILDSGATHHLTSTSHNLQNSRPYLACENGIVGNGKQLPISAVGSKTFCSNSTSFHLPTVYLVPQLTTNLISVAQFCKDTSSYIEFHPSHFFVKDQCSKKTILQGPNDCGLYRFLVASTMFPRGSNTPRSFHTQLDSNSLLWHQRLGHPTKSVLAKILSACNIALPFNKIDLVCSACHISRSHKLPFSLS